jgi:hypothetical protein
MWDLEREGRIIRTIGKHGELISLKDLWSEPGQAKILEALAPLQEEAKNWWQFWKSFLKLIYEINLVFLGIIIDQFDQLGYETSSPINISSLITFSIV